MNNNNNTDLQQDSGLYLQEFVLGLENLPSEIKHHFAEIRNTLEQTKTAEKRISVAQYDLQSIHRQWFNQELEKRKKLLKHEPDLIKRIKNDYNKLEDLSTERIQLAEDSIKLLDRHLNKLSHDLDLHDAAHPELVPAVESRTFTIPHNRKRSLSVDESQDEESDMLDEQEYQTMLDNRNQKRKKREAREATDQSEPLYCFCQQVSYGEMVACDGENCPYEWFHMDCVGLDEPPKGAWYCDHCLGEIHQNKKSSHLSILKKRKKDA